MKTTSCISHDQKDKEYILKLLNKAKEQKILHKRISFSALAMDCMIEYLERILDIK